MNAFGSFHVVNQINDHRWHHDCSKPGVSEMHPSDSRMTGAEREIHIGFVPLTDCAPLIAAVELGLFSRRNLNVRLHREPGWASVREKMLHGEIDAAHAPASMILELSYGLGVPVVPTLTGMVMAHHGNTITLSNELWEMGVRDASSLATIVHSQRHKRRFTFAGVLSYSSQNYLMRKWLRSGGLVPGEDVDLVVVPPPLVAECMEAGHLDGFCVAEPWASAGILRGVGECVTLSAQLDPMHPEKVFMVRERFAKDHPDTHLELLAALREAALWCDQPSNRPGLAVMLAQAHYVGVPVPCLRNALVGPFVMGRGRSVDAGDAIRFASADSNRPSPDKAEWVLREIQLHGLGSNLPRLSREDLARRFREDLYEKALGLLHRPVEAPKSAILS
jgi:ABC-type nitrate/sulfonate/bicarbonate transport system substrate-binding protein